MLPPIFNCSNDMALAANVRQYMPPKSIQQMEADLAELAKLWDEGPWGWSLATKQRYKQMGIGDDELPSDEWIANVRQLSSREFACQYIKEMLSDISDDRLIGQEMTFMTTIPDNVTEGEHRIYKSPWSSSGRGVFVASDMSKTTVKRLTGYLTAQGGFVADRYYENKAADFALEFFVHKGGSVEFLGYSVFHAAENGAYGYNIVDNQERLMLATGVDESLLSRLIDYHKRHLANHDYYGPVGIDMIRCSDGKVHPCIEINLRMNMGILALNLWRRYGQADLSIDLTPAVAHGFQAKVSNGKLFIEHYR